ncbi:MAG: acyl-CoA thioesterase [Carboxylicivirga sp.]|nr:acyl-CoA thioesterase [Carboxylicivirga sp.]MCT4645531.1 acyl-CoA thioesterase [Carboxylicivirga sp.]
MDEIAKISETRICKAIFPETLNANKTLFGGKALQWMDEAAYIAATRVTRQRMFTFKTSEIKFHKAVEPDSIIEVIAKVVKLGKVKMQVLVQIMAERMYQDERFVAMEGTFTLVTLDENNKPKRLEVRQGLEQVIFEQ